MNSLKSINNNIFTVLFPWSFVLLCILPTACIDQISLDVPKANEQTVVIQGKLTKGNPSTVEATLAFTGSFSDRTPIPITGAYVVLADEEENELVLVEEKPGLFQQQIPDGAATFSIAEGQSYQLRVRLPDARTYSSAWEALLPVPVATEISLSTFERQELTPVTENIITRNYVEFFIKTPLRPAAGLPKSYLKWSFSTVYAFRELSPPNLEAGGPPPEIKTCYLSRPLNQENIVVFNGNISDAEDPLGIRLLDEWINFRFRYGFTLVVVQEALSESAFTYWDNVRKATSQSGGLFEATPGKITGNITRVDQPDEEVFGYFYAVQQDTIRRFVQPEEVGVPSDFCFGTTYDEAPEECKNCLLWSESTLEKPFFWQ